MLLSPWPAGRPPGVHRSLVLVVIYVPLAGGAAQLVQHRPARSRWPPRGASPCTGGTSPLQSQGARDALWTSVEVGAARDRDRAGARHAGGVRAAAYPLLRPQRRLAADHPADRAARHRHRHRAATTRSGRCSASSSASSRSWSRTRRSASSWCSTTSGAVAAARRQPRAGVDGPRRRAVHDVPAGDVPDAALGAAGRRAAGLRAVLRRDHRDHVHRRRQRRRRCRSGSSRTCSGPTRRRSSTWSRPC